MYFFEIWVRSNRYHGSAGLTYSSQENLPIGQLVSVPLRNEVVPAVVMRSVPKPNITIKAIEGVIDLPPLPETSMRLLTWLKAFYPSPVGIASQQFIPPGISNLSFPKSSGSTAKPNTESLPALTPDQQEVYSTIKANDTYILHGRTGSGKTRIYLELAKDELINGRSVILLTPEISLTTQLEINFKQVFKDQVIILHSNLTPKQRAERWAAILTSDQPRVIIGPRSAIFSPLNKIGLIILDEEHEPAYKQEQSPYYLTSRVAAKLRSIHGAKLILGSATPLVTDYYVATSLDKPILRLSSLAQKTTGIKLNVKVVDCKDRSLFNRSAYLSQPLIEAIDSALFDGNQALLYLNRRGTARAIICEMCDWQAVCPRCDLPLVYHGDHHNLRCHICGYSTTSPVSCPKCNNPSIKYLSIGTKAVVDAVTTLFPNAKTMRFDADNLKADRLEQHYDELKNGRVDIIVGTQMLAKGLDLPKLSTVGVLLADTSLQLPDFTANERTYQLLQQVIGRVGRGHVDGQAIVQTYQPQNQTILAALNDDWDKFYRAEINERRQFLYPPFVYLLKLSVQRASSASAEKAAAAMMSTLPKDVVVEGPAPAFHERQANKYRWQLVIKAKRRSSLLAIINQLPAGWTYDIDPSDLM